MSSRFLNLVSISFGVFWRGFECSRDGGKDRVRVIDRDLDDGGVVERELGLEPGEPEILATHQLQRATLTVPFLNEYVEGIELALLDPFHAILDKSCRFRVSDQIKIQLLLIQALL